MVVDASRNVVGLYFAGDGPGTSGVANPIQAVLTALDVTLCVPQKLKFVDDITLKFIDDPKLKFFDDHPKLKFVDDPKLKFADDPKLKFFDDHGTHKFADDPKLKVVDDQSSGQPPVGGSPPVGGAQRGVSAAPFVLATPHHSQTYLSQSAQPTQQTARQLEARLQELTQVLAQMYEAHQQGALGPADLQRFAEGCAEYQALLAQANRLAGGG